LWSEIQFVESNKCRFNINELLYRINKKPNCYVVGATHLEDLEIDESLVPNEEYDLVLYNPTTLKKDYNALFIKERKLIVIGKNPDPDVFNSITSPPDYDNLPRPQFLGLLKNCTRFITNSSAAIYEAPYFLRKDQIIMIGDRNKNRTQFIYEKSHGIKTEKLASEKIVDVLKKWWREKFYE